MFRNALSAAKGRPTVSIFVAGTEVLAWEDETVASVLLRFPQVQRRTPISGSPRAPYCLMGVCFDCLVAIDGVSSVQACLVQVHQGMRIERQDGKRDVSQRKHL